MEPDARIAPKHFTEFHKLIMQSVYEVKSKEYETIWPSLKASMGILLKEYGRVHEKYKEKKPPIPPPKHTIPQTDPNAEPVYSQHALDLAHKACIGCQVDHGRTLIQRWYR